MFNVTVLRVKDIIKYIIILIMILLLIIFLVKFIFNNKANLDLISCLGKTSVIMQDNVLKDNNSDVDEDNSELLKAYKEDFFEDILKSQIGAIEDFDKNSNSSNTTELDNQNNNSTTENSGQPEEIKLASTGLTTEVITPNPLALNYNTEYGNIKIKNQTSHELTEEMLNPDITIENKNVFIFHTHTCESYTPSEKYNYEQTGNFRTTDLSYTVARVGDELENQLKQYGYNVIHDKTYHDYPEYSGSYTRSLETEQSILSNNPTDIIFDLHRDAIGSRSDYAPTVKIGEEECAQIMFVMGSDEGGLWHPNWLQNLKFAIKVQAKAEELYPGLFKPLMLTKYRYNQHAGKYASIIEVGATGNTLEQCNNSMKYLAKVLDEVLKN
ncbi:MAG: stage II sporulation protein P [Clostridia bacterium]|nr:stage II sporulation protein P [Clostridia bacterium]